MLDDELTGTRVSDPSTAGTGDTSGTDMGRVLSLSDGIFAFAMTLLVLSLTIPAVPLHPQGTTGSWLAGYLQSHTLAFFTYALGFVLVGIWWMVHHRNFAYIIRYDGRLLWLNLMFLMTIAITPFPIGLITTFGADQTSVAFYAATQTIAGVLSTAMWWHATSGKHLVRPDLDDRLIAHMRRRSLLAPAIFGGSILLTFISPTLALLSWWLIAILQVTLNRRAALTPRKPSPASEPPHAG
ncbi:MAG: DUF1211 domain-containing protein [Thermoplasmata archaeon]|nr:DUF1211 domain-containing protein [Thermoplasmata archaeon]